MRKRSFWGKVICLLTCIAVMGTLSGCRDKESGDETQTVPDVTQTAPDTNKTEQAVAVPIKEFCNDPEVDTFFDSVDENVPVKLSCVVFGEAPYEMVFTDPDLIIRTAKALETVTIGGLSNENPDYVNDAPGNSYTFEMEDGTKRYFSFMMGCFHWKGEYYDVRSFGDLRAMNDELERVGNPQFVSVYSEDRGFYTKCLETYSTDWTDESEAFGGMRIYPGTPGKAPFIQISRITDAAGDSEWYLETVLADKLESEVQSLGCTVKETGEIENLKVSGENYPSIRFELENGDGTSLQLLALVMMTDETLLGENRLVRFCAVYDEEDPDEKDKVTEAFYAAIRYFNLKHMYYTKGEVQPGNTLITFCNDQGLSDWYAMALQEIPDEITYSEDTWYMIEDPETIRQVLLALDTVVIGDVSDAHVGGSKRQLYDFHYHNKGDVMSFHFFADTFDWNGKSYDVLDWGDLKSINIKKKASNKG